MITKRKCLRVCSSQHDPLGIASPITIILRVHFKEFYGLGVDWDKPLLGVVRDKWIKLFKMLVISGGIEFCRSTRPVGAVGDCVLV